MESTKGPRAEGWVCTWKPGLSRRMKQVGLKQYATWALHEVHEMAFARGPAREGCDACRS
eukprot:6181175-Pleurochrysis_carterae.AAC.1